jgi:hypothetical protein
MYRLKVMVPSATRIQACIRGHLKRKEVHTRLTLYGYVY